jgi:large subunit ribosomal protein L10
MNRTEKEQLVAELHQEFAAAPHVVLVDFRGLSVPAATEFRRKIKAAGSRYRVVKNRLALRAAEGTPLEKLVAQFEGTTGIAWTGEDPVVLAKALVDFAKEHPALALKAGVVAGEQVLDAEGVKTLSTMPSLPELRSSLLGLLQAPATKLVRLLATPATQMAQVLKAHQDKIEEE